MSDNIPTARVVKLISNDGKVFEISRKAIERAGTLQNVITYLNLDDAGAEDQTIPTVEVDGDERSPVLFSPCPRCPIV